VNQIVSREPGQQSTAILQEAAWVAYNGHPPTIGIIQGSDPRPIFFWLRDTRKVEALLKSHVRRGPHTREPAYQKWVHRLRDLSTQMLREELDRGSSTVNLSKQPTR
jgi:hypothetical protein